MENDDTKPNTSPKFVGGFFGPKFTVNSSANSEKASDDHLPSSENIVLPKTADQQVGSISQHRMARKSRGTPSVTFCPMCGKVSTQCSCGYQH